VGAAGPRRRLETGKPLRWASNLGLVVVNTILLRLVAPLGVVGVALFARSQGWGLFHVADVPPWLAVVGSVVLLDLAVYLQHVMFHAVPLFWRLHMVHHADLDFDVTTGLRFHTAEILLSLGIKAGVVLLLGAPAVAVLVFEVVLNATSMFNHSNVRMPLGLDRVLRWLVVTPDMHRVHHSVHSRETNSNFGFSLPRCAACWKPNATSRPGAHRDDHRPLAVPGRTAVRATAADAPAAAGRTLGRLAKQPPQGRPITHVARESRRRRDWQAASARRHPGAVHPHRSKLSPKWWHNTWEAFSLQRAVKILGSISEPLPLVW
jgi:hypothetical protein